MTSRPIVDLQSQWPSLVAFVAAFGSALCWPLIAWSALPIGELGTALATGASILGAAFLLSWAVEAAEGDVPPLVGLTVLALVGLIPEYAVDATFAWRAAEDPAAATYVVANMTGGNRLMLGLGWPMVALVGALWLRLPAVRIGRAGGLALAALLLGALWAVVPATLGRLSLLDTAIYGGIYVLAMTAAVRGSSGSTDMAARPSEPVRSTADIDADDAEDDDTEAPPVGPAALLADLPRGPRWIAILASLGIAAVAIVLSAEPFAQSLIDIGRDIGVDEFLLIQWIAPVASEAPELVVALLLALGGYPGRALVLLIAAKVNQWTLLVGTMPLLTSVAAGELRSLPLDDRQIGEIGLTVAQTALGVALLASRSLGRAGAAALLVLFAAQLTLPNVELRWALTLAYLVLAGGTLLVSPSRRRGVVLLIGRLIEAVTGRPGV